MFESFRLSDLPSYAKLFVGLFTALMLCVCVWAGWLYTVEKGSVDEQNLPAYMLNQLNEILSENDADISEPRLRHNLGLAHTHINGQTLLFFVTGLVFLFTSVKPSIKKTVFWVFAVSILIHNVGLSGMGYASIYDDLLAISGVAILVTIAYMAFMIFIDLAKKPTVSN